MSHDTDNYTGRSAPTSDGSDAPLRPKKPWHAPLVITPALHATSKQTLPDFDEPTIQFRLSHYGPS